MQQLKPGQPCGHPGCLAHITHPCEGCGRIGGLPVCSYSIIMDDPVSEPLTEEQVQKQSEWWNSLEERLGVRLHTQQTDWIEGDILDPKTPR